MDRIVVTDVQKTFQLKPGQSYHVDGRTTDRVAGPRRRRPRASATGEFVTLVGPSGSGKSVLLDIDRRADRGVRRRGLHRRAPA